MMRSKAHYNPWCLFFSKKQRTTLIPSILVQENHNAANPGEATATFLALGGRKWRGETKRGSSLLLSLSTCFPVGTPFAFEHSKCVEARRIGYRHQFVLSGEDFRVKTRSSRDQSKLSDQQLISGRHRLSVISGKKVIDSNFISVTKELISTLDSGELVIENDFLPRHPRIS